MFDVDTTPRVIDRKSFTVTTYSKRVETEEIKEDLQRRRLGGSRTKGPNRFRGLELHPKKYAAEIPENADVHAMFRFCAPPVRHK